MTPPGNIVALVERIESRQAKIGVIGLGYVGIALAAALAGAGFAVTGVERKVDHVAKINRGECTIDGVEPELSELIARVTASHALVATADYAALADADIVLIAVETPIDGDGRAPVEALRSASRDLGRVMKDGALVVIESTVAPGTTAGLVVAILEEASGRRVNEGFLLGHCPERVMLGKLLANIRDVPRVCGGSNARTSEAMVALYRTIVRAKLSTSDLTTAELVKTAENAYRDVNIAFANELALICERVGADFRQVRELVNESPHRDVHMAGAGVGGPCIPKDPWLLVHGLDGFVPQVIAAARARNDSMPSHVAGLVEDALDEAGTELGRAKVAVLGYAYLEDAGDTRNSPSATLVACLVERGASVVIHDPWVSPHDGDLWETIAGADATVVMVSHKEYLALDLERLKVVMRTAVLVDGRHVVETKAARAAGFVFRGVGRGL